MSGCSLPILEAVLSILRLTAKFPQFNLADKLAKIDVEVRKMAENEGEKDQKHGLKESITGFGQKVIGEIESLAGVINADPLAQAEGEFNVEVGTIRDGLDESGVEKDQG